MIFENLTIEFVDATWIRVTSDAAIESELRSYFEFDLKVGHFIKQKNPRYKYWDSKIRLYNIMTKQLPAGLLRRVEEFAKKRDYVVYYKNNALVEPFPSRIIDHFVTTMKIDINGNSVNLNQHQQDAVIFALQQQKALLVSPTSSGKSAMMYALCKWYIRLHKKILIVVPSTLLVEQLYSDFNSYEKDFAFGNCQKIYAGRSKTITNPITISTWQSVYTETPKWLSQYEVFIGDEAHVLSGKEVTKFVQKLKGAHYRIGLTGTTNGTQVHQLQLEGLFGQTKRVTTTSKLMQQGVVSDLSIDMRMIDYPKMAIKSYKKSTYIEELKFLSTLKPRNDYIVSMIESIATTGTTLVLFSLIDHGVAIHTQLAARGIQNLYFIDGSVDPIERERIRKTVDTLPFATLVASVGTLKQGVSIPSIDKIVFVTPGKARITTLQSIGRGLRLRAGKNKCTLIDLCDNIPRSFSKDHGKERAKIYRSEEFDYTLSKISLTTA